MPSELTTNELAVMLKDAFQNFQEIMDEHFDKIDQRFDVVEERLDRMDQRFERMDVRIDNIESEMANKTQISRLIEILEANKVVSPYESTRILSDSR